MAGACPDATWVFHAPDRRCYKYFSPDDPENGLDPVPEDSEHALDNYGVGWTFLECQQVLCARSMNATVVTTSAENEEFLWRSVIQSKERFKNMKTSLFNSNKVTNTISQDPFLRHWLGLYRGRERTGDDRSWFWVEGDDSGSFLRRDARWKLDGSAAGATARDKLPWARYEPDGKEDASIERLRFPRAKNRHDCAYAVQQEPNAQISWYDADCHRKLPCLCQVGALRQTQPVVPPVEVNSAFHASDVFRLSETGTRRDVLTKALGEEGVWTVKEIFSANFAVLLLLCACNAVLLLCVRRRQKHVLQQSHFSSLDGPPAAAGANRVNPFPAEGVGGGEVENAKNTSAAGTAKNKRSPRPSADPGGDDETTPLAREQDLLPHALLFFRVFFLMSAEWAEKLEGQVVELRRAYGRLQNAEVFFIPRGERGGDFHSCAQENTCDEEDPIREYQQRLRIYTLATDFSGTGTAISAQKKKRFLHDKLTPFCNATIRFLWRFGSSIGCALLFLDSGIFHGGPDALVWGRASFFAIFGVVNVFLLHPFLCDLLLFNLSHVLTLLAIMRDIHTRSGQNDTSDQEQKEPEVSSAFQKFKQSYLLRPFYIASFICLLIVLGLPGANGKRPPPGLGIATGPPVIPTSFMFITPAVYAVLLVAFLSRCHLLYAKNCREEIIAQANALLVELGTTAAASDGYFEQKFGRLSVSLRTFDRTQQQLFARTLQISSTTFGAILFAMCYYVLWSLFNSLFLSGSPIPSITAIFLYLVYRYLSSLARLGEELELLIAQLRQAAHASFRADSAFGVSEGPGTADERQLEDREDSTISPSTRRARRRQKLVLQSESTTAPGGMPSSASARQQRHLLQLHVLLDHSACYFADWRVSKKHCWSLLGTVLTPDIVRKAVAFVLVSAAFAVVPVIVEGGMSG